MIAKQLENILRNEASKTGISERSSAEMVQRFQSLRGFGFLPKGRGKSAQQLSVTQVVSGILSIVTVKPGYSGLVTKILMKLRPVGGESASFNQATTFGKALEMILQNDDLLETLIEIRMSDSEIYTNGYCRAEIQYRENDINKTAYYVGELAVSLLQKGAEKNFDPSDLISSVIYE